MIYLKLLVPVLIGVTSILQLVVDHYWRDRRTKRYKKTRLIIPLLALLLTIITIFIVLQDNIHSSSLESQLSDLQTSSKEQIALIKRNSEQAVTLANKRDSISRKENKELMALLSPFVTTAKKNYPDINTDQALSKLLEKIESVKERTDNYSSFKVYPEEKKNLIRRKLNSIGEKLNEKPTIFFHIQHKAQTNSIIVGEMVELLNGSGFPTNVSSGLYPSSDLSKPWEVHTLSKYIPLSKLIIQAFEPYFKTNYGMAGRDSEEVEGKFPDNEIHIFISKPPVLTNQGEITYSN